MFGGGGSPCPCLRPLFGAIAVGLIKLFTGPLSMLGFYWTVFIFLASESSGNEYDTVLYRTNGEPVANEEVHNTYSLTVLENMFYAFALPACFPLASSICIFISLIKKRAKFLHWALMLNLIFIISCILVIILICAQGVKFLATLPILAVAMIHVYFLVVISLFKEWILVNNYYSETSTSSSPVTQPEANDKRPPPPPVPARTTPRSILAHSNGNYYNEPIQEFDRTRIVTVTSV